MVILNIFAILIIISILIIRLIQSSFKSKDIKKKQIILKRFIFKKIYSVIIKTFKIELLYFSLQVILAYFYFSMYFKSKEVAMNILIICLSIHMLSTIYYIKKLQIKNKKIGLELQKFIILINYLGLYISVLLLIMMIIPVNINNIINIFLILIVLQIIVLFVNGSYFMVQVVDFFCFCITGNKIEVLMKKHPIITTYVSFLYLMVMITVFLHEALYEKDEIMIYCYIIISSFIIIVSTIMMILNKIEIESDSSHFLALSVLLMNVYYYGLLIITLDVYNICLKFNLRAENYRMFLIIPLLIFGYIYKECFIKIEKPTESNNHKKCY